MNLITVKKCKQKAPHQPHRAAQVSIPSGFNHQVDSRTRAVYKMRSKQRLWYLLASCTNSRIRHPKRPWNDPSHLLAANAPYNTINSILRVVTSIRTELHTTHALSTDSVTFWRKSCAQSSPKPEGLRSLGTVKLHSPFLSWSMLCDSYNLMQHQTDHSEHKSTRIGNKTTNSDLKSSSSSYVNSASLWKLEGLRSELHHRKTSSIWVHQSRTLSRETWDVWKVQLRAQEMKTAQTCLQEPGATVLHHQPHTALPEKHSLPQRSTLLGSQATICRIKTNTNVGSLQDEVAQKRDYIELQTEVMGRKDSQTVSHTRSMLATKFQNHLWSSLLLLHW